MLRVVSSKIFETPVLQMIGDISSKAVDRRRKESSFEKLEPYSVSPISIPTIVWPMDLCQIPPLHLRNDWKEGCLTSLPLTSFFPHSRSHEGKNFHFLQQTMMHIIDHTKQGSRLITPQ